MPCVAQDYASGEVLTLAYMNLEALRLTVETGEFTSSAARAERSGTRARPRATSSGCASCATTATATRWWRWSTRPAPPATPASAPAFTASWAVRRRPRWTPRRPTGEPAPAAHEALAALERTLRDRARQRRPQGSYTVTLLDDADLLGAKVAEEAEEVTRAGREESEQRVAEEAADLLYHLSVLLASRGVARQR